MLSNRPAPPGPHPAHQALPYRTDEEFLASAVPFVVNGVRAGDVVLCVSGERNLGLLRAALPASSLGAVRFERSEDWYTQPTESLGAAYYLVARHAERGTGVRFLGEWMPDGVAEETGGWATQRWMRYETLLNVALAGQPARVLCPYRTSVVPGELMDQVHQCHPGIAGPDGARVSSSYVDPTILAKCWDCTELPEPSRVLHAQFLTAASLPGIRRTLGEHAVLAGLHPDRAEDFVLAVDEVASNAVEHGGGMGALRMWVEQQRLVCEVRDHGAGFDNPFPGYLPPPVEADRGRGLWLARRLCQDVDLRSSPNGTIVRLHSPRL